MAGLMVLAAAAALMPANTFRLVGPEDMPEALRNRHASGGAVVSFVIDATGHVARCQLLQVEGDADVAHAICPAMQRHWFRPARRANGVKMPFVGRQFARLLTPDTPASIALDRKQMTPDLELKVAALPAGAPIMQDYLVVDVDEQGRVRDCRVPGEPGIFDEAPPAPSSLPPSLCASLGPITLPAERDANGQPMAYVTSLTVRLTAEGGPAARK